MTQLGMQFYVQLKTRLKAYRLGRDEGHNIGQEYERF